MGFERNSKPRARVSSNFLKNLLRLFIDKVQRQTRTFAPQTKGKLNLHYFYFALSTRIIMVLTNTAPTCTHGIDRFLFNCRYIFSRILSPSFDVKDVDDGDLCVCVCIKRKNSLKIKYKGFSKQNYLHHGNKNNKKSPDRSRPLFQGLVSILGTGQSRFLIQLLPTLAQLIIRRNKLALSCDQFKLM